MELPTPGIVVVTDTTPEAWDTDTILDAWDAELVDEVWALDAAATDEVWLLDDVDGGTWTTDGLIESWTTDGPQVAAIFTETVTLAPEAGTPGATSQYVHHQSTPATTWTVNHNLGRRVNVTATTLGGIVIGAEIQMTSLNQVLVRLNTPTAGYVIVT